MVMLGTERVSSPEERATALQTVRFLVERRADVNAAGQFGWTALHAAAYQGLNDVIEFLAGQGAKLDAKDSFGQTPLSISYAIITRDIGNAYYQTPRVFRRDTADRLLKLGATPLDRSGVARVIEANRSNPSTGRVCNEKPVGDELNQTHAIKTL